VQFLLEMIRQGYNLIPLDPYLQLEIQTTLRLAFYSTGIAILIGVVPAYLIGVRTARLSRWGLIVSNAALGLPSVSVGIVLFISLPGNTPWGPGWFGINAMILGQTVLATPIIIALSAAAIRGLPDGLIDQARAFGAYGWRLGAFAFREARIGILTAIIVSIGAAIGEVGAVVILGVNQEDANATVSSDILNDIGPHAGTGFAAQSRGAAAGVPAAVEHSIVVLAMLIPLGVILTIVQQWGRNSRAQQQSAAPSDGVTAG
jgi:tungstate transport system permease protein